MPGPATASLYGFIVSPFMSSPVGVGGQQFRKFSVNVPMSARGRSGARVRVCVCVCVNMAVLHVRALLCRDDDLHPPPPATPGFFFFLIFLG